MPVPERSFLRDLRLMDKHLGCKFNGQYFVITFDRGYGEPVNIYSIKTEDGGFRQPDCRDLEIIRKGDLASGDSMDVRLRKLAYYSYDLRTKMRAKTKENIRDLTKDDKHFLMNTIGRLTGQGKPRPAYRQVAYKSRNAVA
jgi:hypothetical protein